MKCIGEEICFPELIEGGRNPELARLADDKLQTVLDIGSSYGESLYLLYHYYENLTHLEGLERDKESTVLEWIQDKDASRRPHLQYTSLFERYRLDTRNAISGRPPIRTMEEYNRIIDVRYDHDFFSKTPRLSKYDVILASNVVHYHDAKAVVQMLERIQSLRKTSSLLYIHFRAKGNQVLGQEITAAQQLLYCEKAARAWGLKSYMHRTASCDRHFTFTNMGGSRNAVAG